MSKKLTRTEAFLTLLESCTSFWWLKVSPFPRVHFLFSPSFPTFLFFPAVSRYQMVIKAVSGTCQCDKKTRDPVPGKLTSASLWLGILGRVLTAGLWMSNSEQFGGAHYVLAPTVKALWYWGLCARGSGVYCPPATPFPPPLPFPILENKHPL